MAAYMKLTKERAKEYLEKGLWKPYIFSDFYERNATQFPDDEALVDGEMRLTWSELNLYANRAALGMLELGVVRDTIMIEQTHDCWEHIVMRLAGEKAGIITLPLMRVLRHAEVEHLLNLTRATSMVIPARFREFDYYQMLQDLKPKTPHLKYVFVVGDEVPKDTISIREMAKRPLEKKYPADYLKERRFRPEEIGTLTATTGTTGFPKVTQWPLTSQLTANEDHVKAWKMTKKDVCLSLAPLPGLGGTITYRCAPQVGARMVLIGHYTAEDAMKLIEKERATILGVVPTQLTGILSSPDFDKYDFSSLRIIRSSGGVTAPSLVDEAEKRIKGCKVVISYGGTDYGSMTHMGVDSSAHARRYTVGHPVANLEIKFLDDNGKGAKEGVITVRGPCTSDGYFENPEATWEVWTKDGWGDTGDLGKLDEEGNLVILGRKKDMIIRGGQNVYPAEIERYLLGIPRIKDVAVVGMPDKLMGERVCAYIVLKPGEKLISFEEVISHLKRLNVAPYKLPERVEIIDALPLAGGQKVDKKAIRADISQKLKAEGKA